jgi:rhodanese-related sulfurtransferase
MYKLFHILAIIFTLNSCTKAQKVNNAAYNFMLQRLLSFSVPTISVAELVALQKKQTVTLLDAREPAEYKISHIATARNVGYDHFEVTAVNDIAKDAPIIIYCSVGYRSEKIGEKLQKAGFTNVRNLYGSVFEWVNEGQTVVDNQNKPTQKVHAFNKKWGIWLQKGQKVY